MRTSRQRWVLVALALIVAALGILVLIWTRAGGDAAATPAADRAPIIRALPAAAVAPAADPRPTLEDPETMTSEPARLAGGQPFWRPGLPHWYGPREDAFIRQPHDYAPGTPDQLGDRISVHLFDLERVQDMVRRGTDGDSEIAVALGHPLSEAQHQRARAVLQRFFDDTVPDIDAVLSGSLTTDAAYARIKPRREQMDTELRLALGLSERAFAELWPHIGRVPGPPPTR